MAELRIEIPEDLKRKMEKFRIDWSQVIRRMIEEEIQNLERLEEIVSRSQMTEKDAFELADLLPTLKGEGSP
ncbi:hypothetical protein [Archaeoglobus fulgidus]|uniref:hypothetical protein n=1 Tax=Archaeoglobus fulgidus TaxID=2234 RepID=UPI0006943194|nr:hypothetical protein [Archaeoglobus fulgidus]